MVLLLSNSWIVLFILTPQHAINELASPTCLDASARSALNSPPEHLVFLCLIYNYNHLELIYLESIHIGLIYLELIEFVHITLF